jgi:hypothetical protein
VKERKGRSDEYDVSSGSCIFDSVSTLSSPFTTLKATPPNSADLYARDTTIAIIDEERGIKWANFVFEGTLNGDAEPEITANAIDQFVKVSDRIVEAAKQCVAENGVVTSTLDSPFEEGDAFVVLRENANE